MLSPPTLVDLVNPKPSYSIINVSAAGGACTFGASVNLVKPSLPGASILEGSFSIQSHIGTVEYNSDPPKCRDIKHGKRCVMYSDVVGISFKRKSEDCEHAARMQGTHKYPVPRIELTSSAVVYFRWFDYLPDRLCDNRLPVN